MDLLEIHDVAKYFPVRHGVFGRAHEWVRAVDGISLHVAAGETLGIVGESGCGKSTLAKLVVRLLTPDRGRIHFAGRNLAEVRTKELQALRREFQMIFQDPFSSLNPRMVVGDLLAEPLQIHRLGTPRKRRERVAELLELVGLSSETVGRYPHEFSGGQRQRIGIARALALQPKLLVADEPVSALDVSVQGEIVNLLHDLQSRLGLTILLISHDLRVVSHLCHRVAVMYLGKIVELLPAATLSAAAHPYTRSLMAAVPRPDPTQRAAVQPLSGDVPSPLRIPTGCPFHPRCPLRELPRCAEQVPLLEAKRSAQWAACHLVGREASAE
ncbi:MAG: ABC transporter ATP-binding protein [Deltaproteobacteria bacterium]|nr:ABC transporter ATP-binding protein [Deltaproteobacteria bacterium]